MESNESNLFIIFLLIIIATTGIANYFSDIAVSSRLFSADLMGGLNADITPTKTEIPGTSEELDLSQTEATAAALELCTCGSVGPTGPLCSHAYAIAPWPTAQTCWLLKVDFVPTTGRCSDLDGTDTLLGPFGFERGQLLPTHGTFSSCISSST